jgi:hypothetical protein
MFSLDELGYLPFAQSGDSCPIRQPGSTSVPPDFQSDVP